MSFDSLLLECNGKRKSTYTSADNSNVKLLGNHCNELDVSGGVVQCAVGRSHWALVVFIMYELA